MVSLATILNSVTHNPLLSTPLRWKCQLSPTPLGHPIGSGDSRKKCQALKQRKCQNVSFVTPKRCPWAHCQSFNYLPYTKNPALSSVEASLLSSTAPASQSSVLPGESLPASQSWLVSSPTPCPHPISSLHRQVFSGMLQFCHFVVSNWPLSFICVSFYCDIR